MIKIKVDSQYAYKLNTPVIASGAVNFVFVEATFSNDWSDLSKTYIFKNGDVSVSVQSDSDTVAVPHEVLTQGSFTLGISGTRLSADNESVEVRATHNALTYEVVDSGSSDSAAGSSALPSGEVEKLREVAKKLALMPVHSGEGEGSAVLCDDSGKAISAFSTVAGEGNFAGRKAFYIRSADSEKRKIYLCKTQTVPVFSADDNTDTDFATPDYAAGDEFSVIIGGGHYILCGKITNIRHNVIDYEGELGFDDFRQIENPSTDDYTLCVPTKPDVGVVTLGKYALCAGLENIAAGYASVASGYDNVAAGNFSAVFGRHNKAGYAGLVSGFRNIVKGIRSFGSGHDNFQNGNGGLVTGGGNKSYGDYSLTEGYKNTSEGENNHVEGKENKVSGVLNSVGGDQNTVTGNLHDVKGQYNTVTGHRNTVRGDHNIADGFRQAVFGVYNAPDTNKVFIVGNGAENNRKNIFTLDASGNAVFTGNITAKNLFDDYLYTFDTYRHVLDFISGYKHLDFSCCERSLRFITTGNDPRIIHNFTEPVNGITFPIIKLRYKVTTTSLTSTASKIYFTTSAYSAVSEDRKATFDLIADGGWHDVILDMSSNTYWDNIKQLRLDIPNSSPSGIEILIKYIGLFHDSDEAQSFAI